MSPTSFALRAKRRTTISGSTAVEFLQMDRLVLCTEPFLAELVFEGGRVRLKMSREGEMTIPLMTSHLQAILDGDTIQVSGKGGDCRLERRGERIIAYCHWQEDACRAEITAAALESILEASVQLPGSADGATK